MSPGLVVYCALLYLLFSSLLFSSAWWRLVLNTPEILLKTKKKKKDLYRTYTLACVVVNRFLHEHEHEPLRAMQVHALPHPTHIPPTHTHTLTQIQDSQNEDLATSHFNHERLTLTTLRQSPYLSLRYPTSHYLPYPTALPIPPPNFPFGLLSDSSRLLSPRFCPFESFLARTN
ncbi:hypothetical protein EJ05DRAFT_335370 [Pseudovirgaria hyperparasitica]|uniref:Uncharacterized protein n=1 Tax=Pseudovirgaria hyperparasitica TaxID=470096 RepID=A0A6A6W8G0_9PEZI|nr:uncharacterized protein EJ05DRAFT_335370 [Pseudovirgaria hyperparasitica]KAF2759168.1 hypothetical protein EJ05DRAFT_335370 [Pseudovirgaria hyperparasitica]